MKKIMKKLFIVIFFIFTNACKNGNEWYCVKLKAYSISKKNEDRNKKYKLNNITFHLPKTLILDSLQSKKNMLKFENDSTQIYFIKNEGLPINLDDFGFPKNLNEKELYSEIYSSDNYCEIKSIITPKMGKNFIRKYSSQYFDLYQYGKNSSHELVVLNLLTKNESYTISLQNYKDEFILNLISSIETSPR